MKRVSTCVVAPLAVLLTACQQPHAPQTTASTGDSHPYPVCVTAQEIQNRTVECTVRDHVVRVDQPKAFGADDTAPTPPELLAASLGSCVISTMQFVAAQRGLDVRNIQVTVEGTIDFSKAMGLRTPHRAGYAGLHVTVQFDSSLSPDEKTRFLQTVFEYGASIDNIEHATPVTYELRN